MTGKLANLDRWSEGRVPEFNQPQILTITAGLMFGMLLAALDELGVATAIRVIGDDLRLHAMEGDHSRSVGRTDLVDRGP